LQINIVQNFGTSSSEDGRSGRRTGKKGGEYFLILGVAILIGILWGTFLFR
jgi:hypothetical protein